MSFPLVVENVSFSYGKRQILRDVSFTVDIGESISIVGPSGSGKSTLLAIISGLLKPTSGVVYINGVDITKLTGDRLADIRRTQMGFVFQFGELLPALTAVENVALPAVFDGVDWETAEQRSLALLSKFEVENVTSPAGVLSGGERQRTALARALVNEAQLIVADEPTGALDTELRDGIAKALLEDGKDEGRSILLVTHDPSLAQRADRSFTLEFGELFGSAE